MRGQGRKWLVGGSRRGNLDPIPYYSLATNWYDGADASTLFQDSAGTTPVTANNDPIGLWQDKSIKERHWSQSTTAAKATYKENVKNGLSCGYFESGDGLFTAAYPYVYDQTWFLVANPNPGTQGIPVNLNNDSTHYFIQFRLEAGYKGVYSRSRNPVSDTYTNPDLTAYVNAGGFVVASAQFTTPLQSFYANGSTTWTHALGPASSVIGTGPFQLRAGGTGSVFHQGHIGEFIIYEFAMTQAQRLEVMAYLNEKWAVY